MNKKTRELLENQDWPYIIKSLILYAYSRFSFWGLLRGKRVKGYSPEDIALEAIEKVLSGQWNWKPEESDLLDYLKFHVVKGLVANLANSKEVKASDSTDIHELNASTPFSVEENLNAKQILCTIAKELQGEELLFSIFEKLYHGLKRKDICEELGIELKEYDNQVRRLRTRLTKMNKKELFKSLKQS